MSEFKIGSKWLYGAGEVKTEVKIAGYHLCVSSKNPRIYIIQEETGFIFDALIDDLKPIPPKPEHKVGQEVWVKAKIVNIAGNYLELQFSPHAGINIEVNSKYAEIKVCEPEPEKEEPLRHQDEVKVQFEGYIGAFNDDGTAHVWTREEKDEQIKFTQYPNIPSKFITKIKE